MSANKNINTNLKKYNIENGIRDKYTFDEFVSGAGNEFAKSASYAVAENPGKTKFNPLLIYSNVGLGKTHLLHSIGNYVINNFKNLHIKYISSEEFYYDFIDSIKNGSTKYFTDTFLKLDLLLIDDIQFFAGKERTQEEFFYIFNKIFNEKKQIVMTSDLPPDSIKGLHDRLISRFQWGLCVDIQPPDLETRVAIIKKKAEKDNLNIPEDILYFIAEKISLNIRKIEGFIIRLLAYASITKSDIDLDLVKKMLKSSIKTDDAKKLSIDNIIDIVSDYYSIPVNKIREKNRSKEVAHCRQVAMYISKLYTEYSLKTIGLNFGGRDHSTVIHAVKQIENNRNNDKILKKDIKNIISKLE